MKSDSGSFSSTMRKLFVVLLLGALTSVVVINSLSSSREQSGQSLGCPTGEPGKISTRSGTTPSSPHTAPADGLDPGWQNDVLLIRRATAGDRPDSDSRRRKSDGAASLQPISPRIYDYAQTKTASELIEIIVKGVRGAADMDEDVAVAVFALTLQLKRDVKVLALIHETLLRDDVSDGVVYSLLGILANCRHEQAIDCLLELASLECPRGHVLWVMNALLAGGSLEHLELEEYMAEVLDDDDTQRPYIGAFFAPRAGTPYTYLLRDDVVTAVWGIFDKYFPNAPTEFVRCDLAENLGLLLVNENEYASRQNPDASYEAPSWLSGTLTRLIDIYYQPTASVNERETILRTLSNHRSLHAAQTRLDALLHDRDKRVRLTAAQSGVECYPNSLKTEAQLSLWRVFRNDPSNEVRRVALLSLPHTDEVKATILAVALKDYSGGRWASRAQAVSTLSFCQDAALPHLESIAASDPDDTIREMARTHISAILSLRGSGNSNQGSSK